MADLASRSEYPVLLFGETGTGKEVIAKYIHAGGARRSKPIVVVNCAAFPRELLYRELFGHEKGAFTGASERRPGKIESARGGMLFLDEVGEMSPDTQLSLLRFLEDRKITRLGSTNDVDVDVRIICATHRDIFNPKRRAEFGFRDDLYYRLNVCPIRLKPLREDPRDLLFLFIKFLCDATPEGTIPFRVFPVCAVEEILWYDWPGNVRELQNFARFYAQYAKWLWDDAGRNYPKAQLCAFLALNRGLEEFLGEEQFRPIDEKIADVSNVLIDFISGAAYYTPVGMLDLEKLLRVTEVPLQVPFYRYDHGMQEYFVRMLFSVVTGNSRYLVEFAPELSGRSSPSLRPYFFNEHGELLKLREILKRVQMSYIWDVLRDHRRESDNAISELTGIHHGTVKKLRAKHRMERLAKPEVPKLSRRDKTKKPHPRRENPPQP